MVEGLDESNTSSQTLPEHCPYLLHLFSVIFSPHHPLTFFTVTVTKVNL